MTVISLRSRARRISIRVSRTSTQGAGSLITPGPLIAVPDEVRPRPGRAGPGGAVAGHADVGPDELGGPVVVADQSEALVELRQVVLRQQIGQDIRASCGVVA